MAVKSISMPNEIKNHLDSLPNASAYVVDLIKKDMKSNKELAELELERLVKGMVKEALKGKHEVRKTKNTGGISVFVGGKDPFKRA